MSRHGPPPPLAALRHGCTRRWHKRDVRMACAPLHLPCTGLLGRVRPGAQAPHSERSFKEWVEGFNPPTLPSRQFHSS